MSEEIICTNNQALRKALFKAYSGKCFYSGRALSFDTFHIDHVLPVSLGGKDIITNYVACDPAINIQKSNSLNLDDLVPVLYIVKNVYAPKVESNLKSLRATKTPPKKAKPKKKRREYPKGFICHAKDEMSRFKGFERTPNNEGYYNRVSGIPMRSSRYFFCEKERVDYIAGYREAHKIFGDGYCASIHLRNGNYMNQRMVKLSPRDKRNLFTFQTKTVSIV